MSNLSSFQLSDHVDPDKIFLINLSDIDGRIDPIQFNSNRVAAIEKLSSNRILTKLSKVTISNSNKVDESDLVYVGLENIQSHTGEYIFTQDKNGFGSANIFNKGNILFPKLRPYLNKVYLAEFDGVCSTEFHVLDSKGNFLNEFLAIYLRSELILNQTKYLMTGNTLPRLQTKDIADLPVPVINLDIQKKIVDTHSSFMRERSFKIQQAENLLSSIDDYLLAELGIKVPDVDNSLPSRMFTVQASELSGGRFDALQYKSLLKDLILTRKDVIVLSQIVLDMKSGIGAGKQDQSNEYEGIIQIRPTNISKGGKLNFTKNVYVNNIPNTLIVKKGDVLFNNTNSQELVGKTAYYDLDEVMSCSNHITRILVDHKKILPKYLGLLLNLYQQNKVFYYLCINWNNQSGVGQDILRKLPIVLPNISKQQEIVQHIDKVRATATQLQQEANEILAQAKQKIERMILGEEQ